jgi:small-conductance mechanosensitive channel
MDRPSDRILGWRWPVCLVLLLPVLCVVSRPVLAQMPGTEAPSRSEAKASETPEQTAGPETGNGVLRYYQKYLGQESPYRPVLLAAATLIVLLALKAYVTRKMAAVVQANAYLEENARGFLKTLGVLWKFVIVILVLIALSGSFRILGLTAGFIGMMLGWSLQQPVTGMAAWLMIIVKKPFRVGDRVIIAGITGDVTGISLTHVTLNQVGGSIGGEERSGRGILIPNAILFQHVIINYTLEQQHMLDELPIRLTFDSDWELAKTLMVRAAHEATVDIIAETGQEPFIRAEFLDWGILVRLRFNTVPVRRQEISTAILEKVLASFREAYPRVRFAIPSTYIRYAPAGPAEPKKPSEAR